MLGGGGYVGVHFGARLARIIEKPPCAYMRMSSPDTAYAPAELSRCSDPPATSIMASNPLPHDYHLEQAVLENSILRVRRADERTTTSTATKHTKFVIAAPIGVCDKLRMHDHFLMACALTARARVPSQVTVRGSAKPGRNGANLTATSFMHSRTLWACVSREAPNVVWCESLKLSDPVVKAFNRRDKRAYPDQRFLDHGDTFDAFTTELDMDKGRKAGGFFASSVVPKTKGETGTVYPVLLELGDIHRHVLEGEPLLSLHVCILLACLETLSPTLLTPS